MDCVKEYLEKHKNNKTEMKVFLDNGVMLSGKVTAFDDVSLVLDDCLIWYRKIISIKK